jgi:hypothetical protein
VLTRLSSRAGNTVPDKCSAGSPKINKRSGAAGGKILPEVDAERTREQTHEWHSRAESDDQKLGARDPARGPNTRRQMKTSGNENSGRVAPTPWEPERGNNTNHKKMKSGR